MAPYSEEKISSKYTFTTLVLYQSKMNKIKGDENKSTRPKKQNKIISLFIIHSYQWWGISICMWEHIWSFDL